MCKCLSGMKSDWNTQIESFKYFTHAFTQSPQFDFHLTRVCEVVSGRPGAHVHFTPLQLLLTFYGGWGTLVLTKLCYLTIFSADINPSLSASAQILTRPRFSQNISWPRAVPSSGHLRIDGFVWHYHQCRDDKQD